MSVQETKNTFPQDEIYNGGLLFLPDKGTNLRLRV